MTESPSYFTLRRDSALPDSPGASIVLATASPDPLLPSAAGFACSIRSVQQDRSDGDVRPEKGGDEKGGDESGSSSDDNIGVTAPLRKPLLSNELAAVLIIVTNFGTYLACFLTVGSSFALLELFGRGSDAAQGSWLLSASPITQGSVVLVSGRLGSIFGHKRVLVIGGVVLSVANLINGFCTDWNALIAVRAISGIGAGLMSPNAMALITTVIPPGKSRNLLLAVFGASAPAGAWGSSFISGLVMRYIHSYPSWAWAFIIVGIYNFVFVALLFVVLSDDGPVDKSGSFDSVGAVLGIGGLVMFNFVWNQSPISGWTAWWIILILVLSIATFAAFIWWEHRVAEPVIPIHAFHVPTFAAVIVAAGLGYMSHGIYMWYFVSWQETIRGDDALSLSLHWIPFCVAAMLGSVLVAWMIRHTPAQFIMAMGVGTAMAACIVLGTAPARQTYWAQTFPATLVDGLSPDPIFVAAQIIACNSVGRKDQGAAGSLVGLLNMWGQALGVGMAAQVEMCVKRYAGNTTVDGYRAALWFGAAVGLAGLAIDLIWVRVDKDQTDGWGAEDADFARQQEALATTLAAARAAEGGDAEKGVKL